MHFHRRCNVNFICSSIMSLHIKFRCGLGSPNRQQIDSKWSWAHICIVFFSFFRTIDALFEKSKQTVFPQTDTKVLPPSSANGRGDTSPQIQVIDPNRGRVVLISKKFKT